MVAHGSHIVICLALVSAACEKGEKGDASASAKRPAATCDEAGAAYAKHFAGLVVKEVEPSKKGATAKAIEAAIIDVCKADKWDETTLGCLAIAPEGKGGVCVDALPKDKSDNLDKAVIAAGRAVIDGKGSASAAASEPATVPTTPRGQAWALGHRIGLVAMSRALSGKHGPAADKAFLEAKNLAKEFGVELPALPALKGDKAADGAAALHYALDEAGKPLLAEISKKHGADAAALFEMAFKSETLQMLYIGDPGDKIVEAVANNIKGNTARAKLPAELSKPLLDKLAANVPPEKLGEALDAWEKAIAAHLAAEKQ
jgi:nucleotide-binding universal stress UspA family protein